MTNVDEIIGDKIMKVDIENPNQLLSHILLRESEIVSLIADTDKWKNEGVIEARVSFNGIDTDGQLLEDVLQKLFKQVENHYSEQYDADQFDQRVEEKAKALLKEHADNALEKIRELSDQLENIEYTITPHWERSS